MTNAYRQHQPAHNQTKVEGLLDSASRLPGGRQLRPWHATIIIERGYRTATRVGGSRVGLASWDGGLIIC